jgi:Ca2+-binding RTX toxin-like protein
MMPGKQEQDVIRSTKERSRRRRVALAGALAASATMAFGVASANAATQVFSARFDDATLNLPILGNSDVLDPPAAATMNGTVDDITGALNVPALSFVFPPSSGTANGLPVTVNVSATDPITGTVDQTTGAMSTASSTYKVIVGVGAPLNATCTYNVDLAFSTGSGTTFNGDPFTLDTSTTPGTETISNGIIQTGWPASYFGSGGSACGTIDAIVNSGPGGLEMGNGFDLTPAPPPSGPVTAPPTCKGIPATIVGTNGSDVRKGTPGKDVIVGLGGNDKLSGLAGNDLICGGAGKDTLNGGKGNDKLYGEAGKDTLKGGPGKDKLKGGAGKDKQVQ